MTTVATVGGGAELAGLIGQLRAAAARLDVLRDGTAGVGPGAMSLDDASRALHRAIVELSELAAV